MTANSNDELRLDCHEERAPAACLERNIVVRIPEPATAQEGQLVVDLLAQRTWPGLRRYEAQLGRPWHLAYDIAQTRARADEIDVAPYLPKVKHGAQASLL